LKGILTHPSMFPLVCLLALAHVTSGAVEFSHATLYDIYDFAGEKEVPLPRCDNGCLIFASIQPSQHPYIDQLIVHDYTTGKDMSIQAISKMQQDSTSQKLPYELSVKGRYSILNLNDFLTPYIMMTDVAVYVVDRAYAQSVDYEIYDAGSMARANVVPKGVVTVMGARQMFVKADKGAANSFTARLTGFDNTADNNVDECTYAYKTQTFEGFEFHVNGPLISVVFDKKNLVAIQANYNWQNFRDLSKAGFIAPPGYNGCAKLNPAKVFRQLDNGFYGEEFDLHSTGKVSATWDIDCNVTQDLVIKDMTNSKRNTVTGVKKNAQIVTENTDFVTFFYSEATPPHGFVARHTPSRV
ncbi:hypothetical protein PMAYCL1PPCAC_09456, partial [Pristionchus mayeri]